MRRIYRTRAFTRMPTRAIRLACPLRMAGWVTAPKEHVEGALRLVRVVASVLADAPGGLQGAIRVEEVALAAGDVAEEEHQGEERAAAAAVVVEVVEEEGVADSVIP